MAEENVDFDRVSQTLTFLPDEPLRTRKCITVQTHEDQIYEGEEQFGFHIHGSNNELSKFTEQNSPARLYIRDNDGKRRERERGGGERGRERERERERERGRERVYVCCADVINMTRK